MIEVVRGIWDCENGFSKKIFKLDDKKKIKIIIDGEIYAIQEDNFTIIEKDWNCDGEVYELYGAYFKINGFSDFITPEGIVSMITEENAIIEYE